MAKNPGPVRNISLTDICTVSVSVSDSANRPTFSRAFYTTNVTENAPVATQLTQLNATSKQSGDVLLYELHNFTDLFAVDRRTGLWWNVF